MSDIQRCPKCGGIHFKTAPCIVRRSTGVAQRIERHKPDEGHEDAGSTPAPGPSKRPVGRPKTITDMRAYKAMKAREYRARPKLTTKREKDE